MFYTREYTVYKNNNMLGFIFLSYFNSHLKMF